MQQQDTDNKYYNFPFSKINYARCIDIKGFNYNPNTTEFNMFMLVSMSEELGEVAGAVKKIIRGFNNREFIKVKEKIQYILDGVTTHRDYNYLFKSFTGHYYAKFLRIELKDGYIGDPENEVIFNRIHEYWLITKLDHIAEELSDFFTYFDLFLTRNNINLMKEVKEKFNKVSEQMNCPEFTL